MMLKVAPSMLPGAQSLPHLLNEFCSQNTLSFLLQKFSEGKEGEALLQLVIQILKSKESENIYAKITINRICFNFFF